MSASLAPPRTREDGALLGGTRRAEAAYGLPEALARCTWTEVDRQGDHLTACQRPAEGFVVDPLGQLLPTCSEHLATWRLGRDRIGSSPPTRAAHGRAPPS